MDIYFRIRKVSLDVGTFRFLEYFFVLDSLLKMPLKMPSRFEGRTKNTFEIGNCISGCPIR